MKFPANPAKFGRRYPWRLWFAESARLPIYLVRGVDYDCSTRSMSVMARTRMLADGLSRTIREIDGAVVIEPKHDKRGRKRNSVCQK